MDPAQRQEIIDLLLQQRDGELAAFFAAYELGDAYESPGRYYGRPKKVSAALRAADHGNRGDEVLMAAAERFSRPVTTRRPRQPGNRTWADGSAAPELFGERPLIFISHVTNEFAMAKLLKAVIEAAFPDMVDVFVSTDRTSIRLGDKWLDAITDALNRCRVQVIIASPVSIARPWVNFEAGAGWVRDVPVVPLCHSGMTPATLPQPLLMLQGALVTDHEDLENTISRMAQELHLEPVAVDYQTFASEFLQTEAQYVREGTSTIPTTDSTSAVRSGPQLRELSADRLHLESTLYSRTLEMQTLRSKGARPSDPQRLLDAVESIGRFWTMPESLRDEQVANAVGQVEEVIADMKNAKPVDLGAEILKRLQQMELQQATTSAVLTFDLDAAASASGVTREAIQGTLAELISAGLVEGFAETFGQSAVDGACRITPAGLRMIRGE